MKRVIQPAIDTFNRWITLFYFTYMHAYEGSASCTLATISYARLFESIPPA